MSALPPYARLLGLIEEPGGVLVMPFADAVLGRPGFLHGGAISGLLEMAAAGALRAALAGEPARTEMVNLTVDFRRGGRDLPTRARATVMRLGRRMANLDAVAWQEDEAAPIAAARMHWLVVRG